MEPVTKIETSTKGEGDAIDIENVSPGHVAFDKKATGRLMRKVDIAIIPLVTLLYLLS